MNQRQKSRAFLQSVGNGPEHELDIAGAALHLAALTRSNVDLNPAELHLGTLTRDVTARAQIEAPVSAEAAAGVLAGVVAGENRYRGDDQTYDDLQNADLLSVIERRKGTSGRPWDSLHPCRQSPRLASIRSQFSGPFSHCTGIGGKPRNTRPVS